jgi:hypothetical protein
MPFLFLIFSLLISCSNSDKFNSSNKPVPEFEWYIYDNKSYLHAEVYLPLKDDTEYYRYYWIIDEEHFCDGCKYMQKKVSYGEHFLKFVLIDYFGDTLSKDTVVRINEPLKITLLSPIDDYEALKTDSIVFQYKISGVDTWEKEPEIIVYISTDENVSKDKKLFWENAVPRENKFLEPPLNELVYYWGIKAFTEQDSAFSEIRKVCIKN